MIEGIDSMTFEEMSEDDNVAFLQYISKKVATHVRKDQDGDAIPSSVDHLRIILRQTVRAFDLPEEVSNIFVSAGPITSFPDARSYLANIEALAELGVLKSSRSQSRQIFTSVEILPNYKIEIRGLVDRIKTVVDKSGWPFDRRESLQKKLNRFLRDLDMERTHLSALVAATVQISGAVGESAEKLKPAVDLMERVMKAIGLGSKDAPGLPGLEEQRLLSPPEKLTEEN
jgi:hypothetical protein